MTLVPLGNRVLVREHEAVKPTLPAGLIAPDNFIPDTPTTGTVINTGKGFTHPAITAADLMGKNVFFSPAAGQEIEFEGEHLLVLRTEEILGIFEETNNGN